MLGLAWIRVEDGPRLTSNMNRSAGNQTGGPQHTMRWPIGPPQGQLTVPLLNTSTHPRPPPPPPCPCRYLAGQGVARQRQAIVSGLRESVRAFQSEVTDVNAKDVMQLVLITQVLT